MHTIEVPPLTANLLLHFQFNVQYQSHAVSWIRLDEDVTICINTVRMGVHPPSNKFYANHPTLTQSFGLIIDHSYNLHTNEFSLTWTDT